MRILNQNVALNIKNDNLAALGEQHLLLVRVRRVALIVKAESGESLVVLAWDYEEYGIVNVIFNLLPLKRKFKRNNKIRTAAGAAWDAYDVVFSVFF